jgi:hypothetical protein
MWFGKTCAVKEMKRDKRNQSGVPCKARRDYFNAFWKKGQTIDAIRKKAINKALKSEIIEY